MLMLVAKVCCVVIILVVTLLSEQCNTLEIHYEHEVNNDLQSIEGVFTPETFNNVGQLYKEPITELPKQQADDLLKLLFGGNLYRGENDIENYETENGSSSEESEDAVTAVRSRVVRQAYPGQAPLYPKLPSSPPYNQYQPPTNYNNQNPQWQPPNNYSQTGYPANGVSNFYPSAQQNSTYGHHPYNPNQPQYPSYNNAGQSQPQYPAYNNAGQSQPQYPSYNNAGQSQPQYPAYNNAGQSQPQYPSYNNAGQNPINGQYPYYNNNSSSPSYPGYRPPNSTVYNSGSNRPPYNQHGQVNNNTYYPGYPPKTPGYRPSNTTNSHNTSQRPPYYPTTPGNTHPVIYDNTSNRPPYNNHNTSYWSTNHLNHTAGPNVRPPYNVANGQNPQYSNSYPNNPYGQPTSTYPHNVPNQGPYQNPSNGYYSGNSSVRPGQYPYNNNSASSWSGPNTNVTGGRPPYTPPYGQNPQNFNSYPQGPGQNPYQSPSNSQYPGSNGYPSNSHGADTFNLAKGYNPSIPNQPPYGSGPGQTQFRNPPGSNGYAHDPTKVSPEYFSYPH